MKKQYIIPMLMILMIFILPVDIMNQPNWWNCDWGKRKQITINNAGSSVLTDFPAYIRVMYDSDMQNDYDDLRFISGTTELDYEIEYHDNSYADMWVRIPTLAIGTTTIYMYYDNPAVGSGETIASVWDTNYVMIHHMGGNTYSDIDDSTAHNNDVTSESGDPAYNTAGKVGDAIDFDGNDYLSVDDSSSLDISRDITLEAWIYLKNETGNQNVNQKGNNYALFEIRSGGTPYCVLYDGSWQKFNFNHNAAWFKNGWHYIAVTYDGATVRTFVDGESPLSYSYSKNLTQNNDKLGIAINEAWKDAPFTGIIDEMRISDNARADDWILQSYHMIANQTTYVHFGDEERERCDGALFHPPYQPPDFNESMRSLASHRISQVQSLLEEVQGLLTELDQSSSTSCFDRLTDVETYLEKAETFFMSGNYIAANYWVLQAYNLLQEIQECFT